MVENKLISMRLSVNNLASLGAVSLERLKHEPAITLVIERNLSLLFDLTDEINTHIASIAAGGASASSLQAVVEAGVIDASTAAGLAPSEGPYHFQAQLCMDTEPELLAGIVASAVSAYREYIRQITNLTAAPTPPG